MGVGLFENFGVALGDGDDGEGDFGGVHFFEEFAAGGGGGAGGEDVVDEDDAVAGEVEGAGGEGGGDVGAAAGLGQQRLRGRGAGAAEGGEQRVAGGGGECLGDEAGLVVAALPATHPVQGDPGDEGVFAARGEVGGEGLAKGLGEAPVAGELEGFEVFVDGVGVGAEADEALPGEALVVAGGAASGRERLGGGRSAAAWAVGSVGWEEGGVGVVERAIEGRAGREPGVEGLGDESAEGAAVEARRLGA